MCAGSWQHGWRHQVGRCPSFPASCDRLPSVDLISYPQPRHICCPPNLSGEHQSCILVTCVARAVGLCLLSRSQLFSCFILMGPVPLPRLQVDVSFDPIRRSGYCVCRLHKLPTPLSRALEKLRVAHLVKKLETLCGIFKVHCRVHKNSPLTPALNQMNPFYTPPIMFL